MLCKVSPGRVTGEVCIPPSKSETMRAIVFAAMASGVSFIDNYLKSPDTYAMIEGVKSFGARVKDNGYTLEITGVGGRPDAPKSVIDVGNSGLALRFLLAFAALVEEEVLITGDESIRTRRPVKPLLEVYKQSGMEVLSFDERDDGCLSIKGKLKPGPKMITGEDSQPVSSLLFSTSFLGKPSEIYVTNSGEKPWIDLTMHWLDLVGGSVLNESYRVYEIEGNLVYPGFSLKIGGDYSTALFPLAAALVTGGRMKVHGLDPSSMQGDKKSLEIFKQMGANIYFDEEGVLVGSCKTPLKGIEVDINHCIDTLPVLSVVATFATTKTVIKGAEIARLKECDRIAVMSRQLKMMGARVEERSDGMVVYPSRLQGAKLSGEADHRIALSMLVAAAASNGESVIEGVEAVVKTYPTAVFDFIGCGMNIDMEI